jgi:hypothetical protein
MSASLHLKEIRLRNWIGDGVRYTAGLRCTPVAFLNCVSVELLIHGLFPSPSGELVECVRLEEADPADLARRGVTTRLAATGL